MWADVDIASNASWKVDRAHVIEENERPNHPTL
jgi:hypothetical protein